MHCRKEIAELVVNPLGVTYTYKKNVDFDVDGETYIDYIDKESRCVSL